jgi:hypothetical protein
MKSIQVLQKEQVVLLKSMNNQGTSSSSPVEPDGVIGAAPPPGGSQMPPASPHQSFHPQTQGDQQTRPIPSAVHLHGQFHIPAGIDSISQWVPKMDFPKFDGSDVRIWLGKCSSYFQLYAIPHDFRVTAAPLHMIDKASHPYQTYKHSPGSHSWEHFVVAVSQEFEVNTHRMKTMELLNLRQTGSVEDYKNQFDRLVYHIMLHGHSISETLLVSHILLGLKEDLRQSVEMHLPVSVSQAATLAYVQEHLDEKHKYSHKRIPAHKPDNKATISNSNLWKAR